MHFLNSLRGIAALLVVFYHVKHLIVDLLPSPLLSLVSMSYLAVDFFFVLSGYILCWKYYNDFRNGDLSSNSIIFIKKRLIRIYPLHLFMLIAYFSIPVALYLTGRHENTQFDYTMVLPHLLLIQNWGMFTNVGWNIPSWSISTEFLAYLSFPLVSYYIFKVSKLMSALSLAVIYLVLISVFAKAEASSIGEYISSLGWIRCLVAFYFGVMVHLLMKQTRLVQTNIVALLVFYVTFLIANSVPNYYYIHIAFAILLFLLLNITSTSKSILEKKFLLFLGDISYSIYMTHYLVRDVLTMLFLKNNELASYLWLFTYVTVTIIVSIITHRLIEVKVKTWLASRFL